MPKTKTKTAWQNRIVGYDTQPASWFQANPGNWRIHPRQQQESLSGVLDSVGWVQNVIVNQRTGNMIDGHLRVTLALRRGDETPIPITLVDLDEAEEALILASLDPIAAMAASDQAKLDELLHQVQSDDERVQQMMSEIAEREGLDYGKIADLSTPDVGSGDDRSDGNVCPKCGYEW